MINENAALMDEMVAALWDGIPADMIEERMVTVRKIADIIDINSRQFDSES